MDTRVFDCAMHAAFKIIERFPELARKAPWIGMTIADIFENFTPPPIEEDKEPKQ